MSDQDFFFDEDEQPKKAEKAAPAKKASATPAVKSTAAAAPAAQSVSMTVAALIGVIALLAGLIIGILLPIGGAPTAVPEVNTTVPSGSPGEQSAPQLSPEQLEGGELPPGHPQIGGGTGSGEASGTTEGK